MRLLGEAPARRLGAARAAALQHGLHGRRAPEAIGQAPERAPEIARLRHVRAHRARPSLAEQVEEALARDLLRRGDERVAMPVHRGDVGEIEGGGLAHGARQLLARHTCLLPEPYYRRLLAEYRGDATNVYAVPYSGER